MLRRGMETEFVIWFQRAGALLFWPIRALSDLGPSTTFGVILAGLYWCWDYSKMARVWFAKLTCSWLTGVLKVSFHTPRPYWIHEGVQGLTKASGFGMPSGHCLVATAAWGELRRMAPERLAWWGFGLVVAGVGLSRLYLGVHSLAQIVVGIAIGIGYLVLIAKWEGRVIKRFSRLTLPSQWLALLGLSLVGCFVAVAVRLRVDGWELPAEWTAMALEKRPQDGPINPKSIHSPVMSAGLFFGFFAGYVTLAKQALLENARDWRARGLRVMLGGVTLGPYVFLTRRFLRGDQMADASFAVALIVDFSYGMVTGLLTSLVLPFLFSRFKI